jgi:hypothetical protein
MPVWGKSVLIFSNTLITCGESHHREYARGQGRVRRPSIRESAQPGSGKGMQARHHRECIAGVKKRVQARHQRRMTGVKKRVQARHRRCMTGVKKWGAGLP